MAKFIPFRGIRYNIDLVGDPAGVMAPPYDTISPALQDDLYARNPRNIVRLTLGKSAEGDSDDDNRYTRAAADFQRWQREGVLVRDPEPSIYLYDQEYLTPKGRAVRQGVLALSRIEEFSAGMVKPHEQTLSAPREDRLGLLKACAANFSPVFTLYSDPCCVLEAVTRRIKDQPADLEVADDAGVSHRLWRVVDPQIIGKAQGLLDGKPLLIADGHHRYETALAYRNYMREKFPGYTGKELFNYVLMYFSNTDDPGLQIAPIHRVLANRQGFALEPFLAELSDSFDIEPRPFEAAEHPARVGVLDHLQELGREAHALAFYAGGETVYYLTLLDEAVMEGLFEEGTHKALRNLDVSILHRLILQRILGISLRAQDEGGCLSYTESADLAFDDVASGAAQAAFLLNPVRMREVRDVANAGEKMPHQSTSFAPSLLTGLVISSVDAGESAGE